MAQELTVYDPPAKKKLKRFLSIDFIRGMALFMNVAEHLFNDAFDSGFIADNRNDLPISLIVLFIFIGYFASWGSFFVMISAVGNTLSMQGSFESGKDRKQILKKQILSGLILIVFAYLVEGFFQWYGFLGTIGSLNGHQFDWSRIIWHSYAMTPVHALAISMVITGLLEIFLTMKKGYKKYIRNIIIYGILIIVIFTVTPVVWKWLKTVLSANNPNAEFFDFPNANIGKWYPWYEVGDRHDYKVFEIPPDAKIWDYPLYFFISAFGGSNHPIFPFLAFYFMGNIIGIVLSAQRKKTTPNLKIPLYGVLTGVFILILSGVLIVVLGLDFGHALPAEYFGDITSMYDVVGGQTYFIPWTLLFLGGQVIAISLIFRAIEYRGRGEIIANRSKFIRRFGIPAYSVYTWHRFAYLPMIFLVSWLFGLPSWVEGSMVAPSGGSFNGWQLLIAFGAAWLWIGFILKLWEKIGYIGGIEWMVATVAALFGIKKSKGSQAAKNKWYQHGKIDADALFYNPEWISVVSADQGYRERKEDSKFAKRLAFAGLFLPFFPPLALRATLTAKKNEGNNNHYKTALTLTLIGMIVHISLTIGLTALSFSDLGIAL